VLFKINVYRLRDERAMQERRKLRLLALMVLLVGVSIVVSGLFFFALGLTNKEIETKQARLIAANEQLLESLGGAATALSGEELSLVRERAGQVRWSDVMATVSDVAIPELWLTRLRLSEGSLIGSARGRTPGFSLEGRLKAGRREESLEKLMDFISALREEPEFAESFSEIKLVSSRWKQATDDEYLEFEIFCPLADK
jgi:Tfp pilus assembly protein PilN